VVQAVVEAGLVDPQRLGIIGHSYGGYTVNCAITGLDCFAAAVSDTGSVNLTSEYGRVTEEGLSFCGYFEDGQGKMGAPPWAAVEKYIQNSPLFQLDRVTTPVLIIHGDRDWNLSQACELFSGLRRLGKLAELAIYEGEGHWQGTWSRANIVDRWQRVLAWFDRYLRAPTAHQEQDARRGQKAGIRRRMC
jgi:dipeptidyl aminopeptidase/acylaminoacyl peptidase